MRILFVLVAVVVTVGPATAQPAAAIAVDGGFSYWMDRGSDECDECTSLMREFGGEVAIFATDSLAVLAGVGLGFFSIDLSEQDLRFKADFRELTVSSGLRYYGPPGRARFFGEVGVGVGRLSSKVELLELRESVSVRVRHITPGVGVDIAVNDRTAVRISGSWDIAQAEGTTLQSVGVGAGLVFNVGRR